MSPIRSVIYCPLRVDERELLIEASLENFNWDRQWFTTEQMLQRPDLAQYTSIDPARGDFGVVAQGPDGPVAVSWALYFPQHAPVPGGEEYGVLLWNNPDLAHT